jgi:hypothetical protein
MTPELLLILGLVALVAYALKLAFCLAVYRYRGDTDALGKAAKIGRFRW